MSPTPLANLEKRAVADGPADAEKGWAEQTPWLCLG